MKKLLLTLIGFIVLFGMGIIKADDNFVLQDAQIIVEDSRTVTRLAQAAIYGEQKVAIPGDMVPAAVMGYIVNTGTATMDSGHGIAVLGLAEDTVGGKIDMYGGEHRINGRSEEPGIIYRGGLNLASFAGDEFNGLNIGGVARSEIHELDGTTPLLEGGGIGFHIQKNIGGAYGFGLWCQDDVNIEGDLQIADADGNSESTFSINSEGALRLETSNNELDLSTLTTIVLGSGGLYGTGYTQLGPTKIKQFSQSTVPDMGDSNATGFMCIWYDTVNSKYYLVLQTGDTTHVKVELQ